MAQGRMGDARSEYQAALVAMKASYKEDSDVLRQARVEFAALER
jgi:hypothetical protein